MKQQTKNIKKNQKIARKKNIESLQPEKTGVIPPFYNSNRTKKQRKKFDPIDDELSQSSDSDFSDLESFDGNLVILELLIQAILYVSIKMKKNSNKIVNLKIKLIKMPIIVHFQNNLNL